MKLATLAKLKGTNKENIVHDMGMGPLMHLKDLKMKMDFCSHLVEIFDVNKEAMLFCDHLIPLTVDDMESILGLKNKGADVASLLKATDGAKILKKYRIDASTNWNDLAAKILSLDQKSEELKACVLLYIITTFLCPSTSNTLVAKYANCLCDEGFNGNLN